MKVDKILQDDGQEDICLDLLNRVPRRVREARGRGRSCEEISSKEENDVISSQGGRNLLMGNAIGHNRSLKKTPFSILIFIVINIKISILISIFTAQQIACSPTTGYQLLAIQSPTVDYRQLDSLSNAVVNQPLIASANKLLEQRNLSTFPLIATLEPRDQILSERHRNQSQPEEQVEKVRRETPESLANGSTAPLATHKSSTPLMEHIFDSLKDVEQATTIITDRVNPSLQHFVNPLFDAPSLIKTLETNDQIVSESTLRDAANNWPNSDDGTPSYSIEEVIPASVVASRVPSLEGRKNRGLSEVVASDKRQKSFNDNYANTEPQPEQQQPVMQQHNMDIRLVQSAAKRPPVYMSAPKQISELGEMGRQSASAAASKSKSEAHPSQGDSMMRKSGDLRAAAGHGYKSSSYKKVKKYKKHGKKKKKKKKVVKVKEVKKVKKVKKKKVKKIVKVKRVKKVKKKKKGPQQHNAHHHYSGGGGGGGGHHDMGKYYE